MAREDSLLDSELDGDEDEPLDSGSDNSAPPEDTASDEPESKRINALMGKWQSEQAKSAKLQKELDALKATPASPAPREPVLQSDGSAEADQFVEFTRDAARQALFASAPKLAAYGLNADDITGRSLEEMKSSLKAQIKLVEGIESSARNQVLAEHGLDPEVSTGASTEKAPDFSKMSDKEFDEWEQTHRSPTGRTM